MYDKIIENNSTKYRLKEEAELVAYQNSPDEDGWTYRVVPSGDYFVIEALDADGFHCGYL